MKGFSIFIHQSIALRKDSQPHQPQIEREGRREGGREEFMTYTHPAVTYEDESVFHAGASLRMENGTFLLVLMPDYGPQRTMCVIPIIFIITTPIKNPSRHSDGAGAQPTAN